MERKLTLTNAQGKTIDLMSDETLFTEVSDLGFSLKNEYKTVGSNFLLTDSEYNHTGIKGTMYFKGDNPYQTYFDLVKDFTNQDLTLTYNTVKEFKLSCRMTATTKKEHTKDYRQAEITFMPNGLWYSEVSEICIPKTDVENGKTYDYTYAYKYSPSNDGYIVIESDTNIPSPVRLIVFGQSKNTSWQQYVNNKIVATGKMNWLTIQEDQRLEVDATNVNNAIEVQSMDGKQVVDAYRLSDFSTERFLYLRKGENKIVVNNDEGTETTFIVEARLNYESV